MRRQTIFVNYLPSEDKTTKKSSTIIKIVATNCQILRLKFTKFDFGWGSAPDPTGGAPSASPDSLAGYKWPTSKERAGKGMKGREDGRGQGDGEREVAYCLGSREFSRT